MEANILYTEDLGQFKIMSGNRILDRQHVSKLKKSFKVTGNELMKQRPIIINHKNEIVDGQHRYAVCKELGMGIWYTNSNEYDLEAVQVLNCNNKNWNMLDFANMFVSRGNSEYHCFLMFKTKHGIDCDSAAMLLTDNSHLSRDSFRQGLFRVKSLRHAEDVMERIFDFEPSYKNIRRRSFIRACMTMFKVKGYSHKVMKQKIETGIGRSLQDVPTTKMYLAQLESIYNYKNSKNRLRFI
jgi:hypothetical protein